MMRITDSYNSHFGHLNIPSKVCLCASLLIIQKYLINHVVDQKFSLNLQRKKVKLLSALGVTALAIGLHTYFGPKITCITLGSVAFAATIFKFCNKPRIKPGNFLDSPQLKERVTLLKTRDTHNMGLERSFCGKIIHASNHGLAILNGTGLFTSSDGWNWKLKREGWKVEIQQELRMGTITFKENNYAYYGDQQLFSFKLHDNFSFEEIQGPPAIINDSYQQYELKNIIAWLPYLNETKIIVDTNGLILLFNKTNKENPYSFFMKVEPGDDEQCFGQWEITEAALQGDHLSVIFRGKTDLGQNINQLKVFDMKTKIEDYFLEKGKYHFVGDYLITSNEIGTYGLSDHLYVHNMKYTHWIISWIDHKEEAFKIRTLSDDWIILECYKNNDGRFEYSHLTTINLRNQKSQQWNCAAPRFSCIAGDYLVYGNKTLTIRDLKTADPIAKDVVLPDLHTVLDAKLLGDKLLVYYTNAEHLQRLIKLDLSKQNLGLKPEDESSLPSIQDDTN